MTQPPDRQPPTADSQQIIDVLKNQIADLKAQLELSQAREIALIDERSKLIDLLYAEKAEKRALIPQGK